MASTGPTTVIVPFPLGAASKYPKHIFPHEYYHADDPISKGSVLLSATLEEMVKISEMGIDLLADQSSHLNIMTQYQHLATVETKLQNLPKSYNPFTLFRDYRAARFFHAAAKAFFIDTKRKSERMQREEKFFRTIPTKELRSFNDDVPQDAMVDGIAITLPGQLDEDAQQKILSATNAIALNARASDPFMDDPRTPQLADDESVMSLADTASLLTQDAHDNQSQDSQQTEPILSPGSQTFTLNFINSVLAAGSNVRGTTLNHGMGDPR